LVLVSGIEKIVIEQKVFGQYMFSLIAPVELPGQVNLSYLRDYLLGYASLLRSLGVIQLDWIIF